MRRAGCLAVCLCLLLTLASCAPPQKHTRTLFAMDTVMDLTVYGDESLLDDAQALIERLEAELSVTHEGSGIYALNRDGSAQLSGDAKALLTRALELCALTDGALDITVYPVVRAWGFTTGEYRVPGEEELSELLRHVDYTQVRDLTLPEGVQVDLGAVAKGWTSDRLAQLMREKKAASALLNLGGNVYALGRKPDGTRWRVGIRDPFSAGILAALEVEDKAVVTSGGYERYFEEDGVRYHHIIDPKTGRPAGSGLASVTVVGPDGTLCDGLSTGFFVMGLERASRLWRDHAGEFDAVFVTDGGEVYITEGLEGSIELMNGYKDGDVQVIRRG